MCCKNCNSVFESESRHKNVGLLKILFWKIVLLQSTLTETILKDTLCSLGHYNFSIR